MSEIRQNRMSMVVGELLTLRSAEYFLFLESHSVLFVRVCGRGRTSILLREDGSEEDPKLLARFCESLIKHPSYFGQPVGILLNNRQGFSYIKRQGKASAAQLYEKVSTIPKDNLEIRQTAMQRGKTAFFVWQAVRKDYLESILKLVRRFGLRVSEVTPLESVLLANGPVPQDDQEALYLYRLPSGCWYYAIFKANGDVLFGQAPAGTEESDEKVVRERLVQAFGPWSGQRLEEGYDSKRTTRASQRMGWILQARILQPKALHALAYRAPDWRRAAGFKTALNSSRLLAVTLVSLCLLLSAVTVVTSIWAGSGNEPLEAFQRIYGRKLALNRELDSLDQIEKKLVDRQGEPRNTAAIISAFCQQSFAGLNLSGITVDYSKTQIPTVEARGTSSRESTVFALRENLAGSTGPHYSVTVNSVRPQLRTSKTTIDTLYEFSISLMINEEARSK